MKSDIKIKWTTLSIDTELKPLLDKVMIKMGRKMTYNQIIKELTSKYLEE